MIKIGKYNILRVVKEVDFGIYLDGGEAGEILMPKQYVPEDTKPDDELYCFIYLDSEDRIIATTLNPHAVVDSFAFLQVKQVDEVGAFLDWGLMKDLFVPFREQKLKMKVGDWHVVYVHLDTKTNRIVASAKLEKFIDTEEPELEVGEEVDLLIYQQTDLGNKAIINNQYSGLLYKNELMKPVRNGERYTGYVKEIRSDNKIDLTLRKPVTEGIDSIATSIIEKLQQNAGYLAMGDKSPADEIYNVFGISKKLFKKAVGDLYRRRLITLEGEGIRLVPED